MSWQDAYYDSKIDYLYEDFCEETQQVVRTRRLMIERESILSSEANREAKIDDYYIRLHRGEIKRIR